VLRHDGQGTRANQGEGRVTWSVLDSADPDEAALWLELWNEWPAREVSAHPSYLAMFAKPAQKSLCAIWRTAECTILFPFHLRRISDESWAASSGGWDLASPYGYGGPFSWGTTTAGVEAFWEAFDRWAIQAGIVSAFARLSLFPDEVAPMLRGEVAVAQMNVVRDLAVDDEALRRSYEHKVRKNINRAIASGLRVEFDPDGSRLDEFLSVYLATMERRDAAGSYYFDRAFFARVCGDLPGQFVFAHVLLEDRVVSTELVLLSATHAYSFLGGTMSDSFHLRPNDLLKHEVARWVRDHGRAAYVLGGGYGGEDGIYRYKRSFAPLGEREFKVWRYVVNPGEYERLVQARIDAADAGHPWEPQPAYFPSYRG
jgi:hypothetical protein